MLFNPRFREKDKARKTKSQREQQSKREERGTEGKLLGASQEH